MSIEVTSPFSVFYDRSGQPLDNGYIYIGAAGVNPEVSPIAVYWDDALSITAAQPIRTLAGYPSRNGSPGTPFVNAASYSIVVRDRTGTLVYSALNDTVAASSGYSVLLTDYGNLSTATGFTDALRAAIEAVASTGGTVLVPSGSYTLNQGTLALATLLIPRGVVIKGMGRDVTTITQTDGAYLVIGGTGAGLTSGYYSGIEDLQINTENGATWPGILFDRASRSWVKRVLMANVDYEGITFGTALNPSLTGLCTVEDVEILLDAANASGVRWHGGGSHQIINCVSQGTNGQNQTALDINNSANIDTIVILHGGTGDCDYGFRWRGTANLSNVFATGSGWDRCAQGAINASPAGTADASDWIFDGIYAAGVASTAGIDAPAIRLTIGAGRSLSRVKFSGLAKDARTNIMLIEGGGTVSDIDVCGLLMTDGARAAANTYPAFRDSTSAGIARLNVTGCVISATASTYSFGIQLDTVGSGTNLKDILNNTINGGATGDIQYGGITLSAHLGNGGKQWTDIASATTTNLATANGDYGDVTGTATITALGTAPAGIQRTANFTGAATITHNATSLILPWAANIVTAAGDIAVFRSLGSGNWRCVAYQRAAVGYAESEVLSGSAVSLTSTTAADITSISLTPGTWLVTGNVRYLPAGGCTPTVFNSWVNNASVTIPTAPNKGGQSTWSLTYAADTAQLIPTGSRLFTLTTTTTIYLGARATFGGGTMTAHGAINAVRVAL